MAENQNLKQEILEIIKNSIQKTSSNERYQQIYEGIKKNKNINPNLASIQILENLESVLNLINQNELGVANSRLDDLNERFKREKNKFGKKLLEIYLNMTKGLMNINEPKKAKKDLESALKNLPPFGFEFEHFKINTSLGIIYDRLEDDKKAKSYYFHALSKLSIFDEQETTITRDELLEHMLIDKLFPKRHLVTNFNEHLFLLLKRLSFLNESLSDEYKPVFEEIIDYFLELIANRSL